MIYADLWSDAHANPAQLVRDAIRRALDELQRPGSSMLKKLAKVSNVGVAAFGLKFGFKLDRVGEPNGVSLAHAIETLVDQARTDIVLIVDEVQQAVATDEGNQLLLALKAARDAVNPRPGTPGHFLFIGTGSHRAMVIELTSRPAQAFAGATSLPYPVLDADYVAHLLARLAATGTSRLPSQDAAVAAFRTLGNRPEDMIKALRQLQLRLPPDSDPDSYLTVIAATLRTMAADIELARLDQLGALATAVFDRVAAANGDVKGVFSADAAANFSRALGREVKVEEIQPVVNSLMDANLIMRRGHGLYGVTDPFVQETWLERKQLLA